MEGSVETTNLANGVRIVTEAMPQVRSAAVGCWVGVGNRDEPAELAGASHFLEHLLFKGTDEWPARELAEAVDRTGGDINAYTSKEHTAYHARVPDVELPFALDVLTGVLRRPAFDAEDVDGERHVILEELLLSEDMPDDTVHTALQEALFPEHPLGWEVLGSKDSIQAMTVDDVHAFHQRWYQPTNLVFAAAGNVEHAMVVDAIDTAFGSLDPGTKPERFEVVESVRPTALISRPAEQTHVALGWRGLPFLDPDRYAFAIANYVIGGGLSSRLFQEVREKRGLVYSIFSSSGAFSDAGTFMIYAGTANDRVAELLRVIDGEIASLLENGITEEELEVARSGFEGATLLGLEDSGSRMNRLGAAMTVRGYVPTIEDFVTEIRSVTVDDVHRVISRVLGGDRTLAAVGAVDALG